MDRRNQWLTALMLVLLAAAVGIIYYAAVT